MIYLKLVWNYQIKVRNVILLLLLVYLLGYIRDSVLTYIDNYVDFEVDRCYNWHKKKDAEMMVYPPSQPGVFKNP